MKKKILTIVCISVLTVVTLVGCGKTETKDVVEEKDTVVEVEESTDEAEAVEGIETETPHKHSFTETITKEATCLEAGEKTLTCECGESSVEEVPATGHDFSNYVSNEDATYTADGTETGWYRIEYADSIAYVSDEYLVDEKVEVQASAPAQSSTSSECPYPLYTVYEDDTCYWFYAVWDGYNHPGLFGNYWACVDSYMRAWNVAHGYNEDALMMRNDALDTPYVSDGMPVLKIINYK